MSSGIEIKVYGGGKERRVKEVPQKNRSDNEVEMLRTWIIPSGDRTKNFTGLNSLQKLHRIGGGGGKKYGGAF